jgi:hypothetical protein
MLIAGFYTKSILEAVMKFEPSQVLAGFDLSARH